MTYRSDCPIANALDLLGDKWTLLIVRDMLFRQKRYYGEFLQSREGISTNILADRLARLEHGGILTKQQNKENKTRYIYTLTEKGLDLLPMVAEISLWSLHYNPHTTLEPDIKKMLQTDKLAFIAFVRQMHQPS